MPVHEITEIYERVIPRLIISPFAGLLLSLAGLKIPTSVPKITELELPRLKVPRFLPYPLQPYSREPLEKEVENIFKGSLTFEFKHKYGDKDCIAGAVAREYNEDAKRPDILRLFDSESDPVQPVGEVLLASSNAPFLFDIPSAVGGDNFIDGAVGGMIFS